MKLIKRFFNEPLLSYFLLGPRATGKSTLLKSLHPDALWIDLLKPDQERAYLAKPERLEQILLANQDKKIIIIDEVQRVPALLSVVHYWIEKKTNQRFILTGSSARKLKKEGVNLLAGRALRYSLCPFMAAELEKNFNLDDALNFGMLPIVYNQPNKTEILQAYVSLYLREEVMQEGLIRSFDNFSRFLEVISFSHGQILSITNIANECQVKRKTVENYISILEDLLLAFRLPVFNKKAKRELASHPKFFLFDTGIFMALRPKGPFDKAQEIQGAALEGLIAQHLQAFIAYHHEKHELFFYKTRSKVEVDFILYGPSYFLAIEVKSSLRISYHDTKPLESFLKDYPMAKGIILYRGQEKFQIGNVVCMPCEEFLLKLVPNQKNLGF